ncbi:acyl--CoA ligase [Candidatus Uhrbacteria bacterium]|nr:acyl--CoA ligase [Candidatus Uhrbacteria bacterium]
MNSDSYGTICDFLDKAAERIPHKTALIFENQEYTYGQIGERSDRLAGFFAANADKGEAVAILLQNSPEFIWSYFGVLKAGTAALLIPPNISDESLRLELQKVKPKYIVSEKRYEEKLRRVSSSGHAPIYIEARELGQKQAAGSERRRQISGDDVSTVIFTSGTTGEPKGVKLRHRNAVSATKNIINILKWNENDIDVNVSPLSHSFGLGHLHCVFAAGGTTVLFRDAIGLKNILAAIFEKKATTFGAAPAILRLMLRDFRPELERCRGLRFVQTNISILEEELVSGILSALPLADFYYYYGLTEASRSAFVNFRTAGYKQGLVGAAVPGAEIKIMDASGGEVLPGVTGEICIKGPHVIDSYWDNDEASKSVSGGWLHTGDMGHKNADGFVYFDGRQDDIINVSGEKVFPYEIEQAAKTVDGVADAAAVGASDPLLGEAVRLFITEARPVSDEVIRNALRGKLEGSKLPGEIFRIDSIPRTENGKIIRHALKARQTGFYD